MSMDIQLSVSMNFFKKPANATRIACSIAFLEWPEAISTKLPVKTTGGVWNDRAQQSPEKFKKWDNYMPDEMKNCSWTPKDPLTLTDTASPGYLTEGGVMAFYQLFVVMGGKDCNCNPKQRYLYTHVVFKYPNAPTFKPLPSTELPEGIPYPLIPQ